LIDWVHPSPTAMARIGIHILAADYATFKALMPSEEKLGKDYSAWIKRRLEEELALRREREKRNGPPRGLPALLTLFWKPLP
jgi:hypothetical protein